MSKSDIDGKPLGGGHIEYVALDKLFTTDQWKAANAAVQQIFTIGNKVGIDERDAITIIEMAHLPPALEKKILFKAGLLSGMKLAGVDIEVTLSTD